MHNKRLYRSVDLEVNFFFKITNIVTKHFLVKILQGANSWLLKDYNLEKGKHTKIKITHGDNKTEILEVGGFETSQNDIRQIDEAYKILQKKERMPKEISQQVTYENVYSFTECHKNGTS